MKYLLTGGAGYIGAHTAIEFLNAGHQVIVADNFANSSPKALERVQLLTGKSVDIYEVDLLDKAQFRKIFEAQPIDGVVHFAGLKAVGESVEKPVDYYHTNIVSSLNLLQAMLDFNVGQLVFSSSATVYGEPEKMPIDESTAVNDATNPYGRTKLMIERIIEDVCKANPGFNAARLRYFNPAGAHESGEIGEDPKGIPNNLLPYVTQVAVGKRPLLTINGNDVNLRLRR